MKNKHLIWLIIIWSSIIIVSFAWNYSLVKSNNQKIVLNKSQAFFERILTSRAWNSQHGGVYVPITATIQPNLYLKDTLRDIVTVDGMKLTKINPAYMTRQIAEIDKEKYALQFHITSLNPIRPANKADKWETKALNLFEGNAVELLEHVITDSSSLYRYMAPLITEKSCLNCHSHQGYKLGDIRGGISVSFPSVVYIKAVNNQLLFLAIIHLILLSLGVIGLVVYSRLTNKYFYLIKNKNEELVQLNATKDKFFSIIAHDLKGPFNSLIGFSELLIDEVKNGNYSNVEKFSTFIYLTSNQTFNLVLNLLEWSRSQTGKIEFNPESILFSNLIDEINNLLISQADKKGIKLINKISCDLTVFGDKNMLETVIRNLVSNAIKYSRKGGIIIIESAELKDSIQISVSDNGVGISEENIEKLFLIEHNLSTLGTDNENGTGLGLILCKEFVDKHNGKIWVESEVGKGSEFKFILPVKST